MGGAGPGAVGCSPPGRLLRPPAAAYDSAMSTPQNRLASRIRFLRERYATKLQRAAAVAIAYVGVVLFLKEIVNFLTRFGFALRQSFGPVVLVVLVGGWPLPSWRPGIRPSRGRGTRRQPWAPSPS